MPTNPPQVVSQFRETLEHIYGLSDIVRNTSMDSVSIRPPANTPADWPTLRMQTLRYLEDATKQLKNKSPEELAALEIVFERGGKQSTFPLWNMINGPLSRHIYHTGQIVSFRRTNGNPLPKGVNVFTGKQKPIMEIAKTHQRRIKDLSFLENI